MDKDDMLLLARYNEWANDCIMRRASHLTSEQLGAPCWLSGGSLLKSLLHIVDTQWAWRMACETGTMPTRSLEPADFTDIRQPDRIVPDACNSSNQRNDGRGA